MTLAYAQALQYWAEEANPSAPSETPLLAMSILKLMWCMGKHTTFHDCDVFEGLTNALPRATVKDTQPSPMMSSPADYPTASSSASKAEIEEDALAGPVGMPLVDPTISTAMSEVEDTQPSPVGTPLMDDPTI